MGTPTTTRSGPAKKAYKVRRKPKYTRPPTAYNGRPIERMPSHQAQAHLETHYKVYGLVDPRDGLVRAVGEAQTPLTARLRRYSYAARNERSGRIYDWLRQLQATGLRPTIVQLDASTEAEGFALFPEGQLYNEQPAGSGPAPALEWTVEWTRILGRVPDDVIADWRGVCEMTISNARRAMGIPTHRDWLRASRA